MFERSTNRKSQDMTPPMKCEARAVPQSKKITKTKQLFLRANENQLYEKFIQQLIVFNSTEEIKSNLFIEQLFTDELSNQIRTNR